MPNPKKHTIMIIDDDSYINAMLAEALAKEGFHTLRAYSGTEAAMLLAQAQSGDPGQTGILPDLILLDLMLPGLSGEELLPKLGGIPVIVVSAKVDVSDKVTMLLGGAADYVQKPFDLKELLARITVQLRLHANKDAPAPVTEKLVYDQLVLDLETREVWAAGTPLRLTRTEYAILKLLMRNSTRVITKSVLLDRICVDTPDCVENSLKVHVSNLRRKLRDASGKDYIESVWGIGFKMTTD